MTTRPAASRRVSGRTPVATLPAAGPKRPLHINGRTPNPPATSSPEVCSFQLPKVCSFRLPAEKVFRGLVRADDPFDHDSIALVAGDVGYGQEEVRLRVVWGEKLGLLSRVGQNGWTFNPLVRRLIEAGAQAS